MDEIGDRLQRLTPEKRQYILRELPRHLLASGQDERYCRLFMDRSFIQARLKIVSPLDLLEDIARAKRLARDPRGLQEWFQPLEGAIEAAIHDGIAGFLGKAEKAVWKVGLLVADLPLEDNERVLSSFRN